MKKFLITIIFLLNGLWTFAQEDLGPIEWITFEEAEKRDSVEKRPFLIDVYTDWCGWCKRMMATTFQHKNLAKYINQNFYCVRFDAETKDTVKFNGKEWTSDGRVNKLAYYLLGDRLSYPTIVYIDRDKRIHPIPGYMQVKDIEPVLVFFAENLQTTVSSPDVFTQLYMNSFPEVYAEDLKKIRKPEVDTLGKVKWLTMKEMREKYDKTPKPILIDIYVDDKYRGYLPYITMNSMIHERAVLKDSALCNYINKNYYPVRIEATTTDSLYWFDSDKPFVSTGKNMPNGFTNALMNGNYKFPAMFFFDKEHKYVANVSDFFEPSFWHVVLQFYAEEAYKREKFETFYNKTVQK
ncbi:MAG: thioredoxin fold domain-containing protein [Bacteroidales bacterium]|nr:thioredoxin fold domain-containing protein [Bacteroidales bacterium]